MKSTKGVVDASTLISSNVASRRTFENAHIWKCDYCQSTFKSEVNFMKHWCIQMERANEIKTPAGQAAYSYYCDWFKVLKRKVPPIETFIHSSMYNAFKRLVEFFNRVNISSSLNYIRFMAESDISPTLWARDQSFSTYLAYLDTQYSPVSAVNDTINFLRKESNSAEIDESELLSAMTLQDIAVLTQRRLLSPYFLIYSDIFRNLLGGSSSNDKNTFLKQVPLMYWAKRLQENSDISEKIARLVKESNL